MRNWYFWISIITYLMYFVVAEDKTSVLAFIATMSYLFYIDDKIDEKDN